MNTQNHRQEAEVLKKGEALYFGSLKGKLEAEHLGDYVAIDVDTGRHLIELNKLQAIKRAQKEFGDKLFYLVRVGDLNEPTINFRERENVAWIFS